MNKQKILTSLKQNFMLKRYRAQEKCDEFIAKLCENNEFNELYSKINKLQLESLKTDLEIKKQELNSEINVLQSKIDNFLKINNIDKQKLQPQYDCKICDDTGINNGKICECLLNELNKKISTLTSSQSQFKNFAMQNADRKSVV